MFGIGKKGEKVKTYVEGVQQEGSSLPPPPQPPIPISQGNYVEGSMQIPSLPVKLLLKIQVDNDVIPILIKIDKGGNISAGG